MCILMFLSLNTVSLSVFRLFFYFSLPPPLSRRKSALRGHVSIGRSPWRRRMVMERAIVQGVLSAFSLPKHLPPLKKAAATVKKNTQKKTFAMNVVRLSNTRRFLPSPEQTNFGTRMDRKVYTKVETFNGKVTEREAILL